MRVPNLGTGVEWAFHAAYPPRDSLSGGSVVEEKGKIVPFGREDFTI
jgi:hypothetical protein